MTTPRSYTYATTGFMLGVLVGLILNDAMAFNGWSLVLWALLVGLAGAVGGFILALLDPRDQVSTETSTASTGDDGLSTTMRFFALSNKNSSELKPLRVTFPKPPQSPPDMELELLIDNYDDTARCNVIEGVLSKLDLKGLIDRIVTEANGRAPRNAKNPQLKVTCFRSEGPIRSDGLCEDGWSFDLIDPELGLGAYAVATRDSLSIHYFTAVTHFDPVSRDLPNLPDALDHLYEQCPELSELPLYLRYTHHDELLLYPRDLSFILDVDISSGRVRNLAGIKEAMEDRITRGSSLEAFDFESILEWSKGGEPEDPVFAAAIEDKEFADGLRTFKENTMLRTGRALLAQHGPGIVRMILERVMDVDDDVDPRLEAHLLAHIPNGLAVAALHDITSTAPEDATRSEAAALYTSYRKGERTLNVDPVGQLDFVASRNLMGKIDHRVVPLRSSFAPEEELIAPLDDEIGLTPVRKRLLSGDSHLGLEIYLRPERGESEALVVASPLPVPCYVLHIIGGAADTFAERTEKAGLTYGKSTLLQDLKSTVPTRVHRAALYLAALERPSPTGVDELVEAYRKGRADRNLRRAVILALSRTPGIDAREFLADIAENEEHDDHDVASIAMQIRADAQVDRTLHESLDEDEGDAAGRSGDGE